MVRLSLVRIPSFQTPLFGTQLVESPIPRSSSLIITERQKIPGEDLRWTSVRDEIGDLGPLFAQQLDGDDDDEVLDLVELPLPDALLHRDRPALVALLLRPTGHVISNLGWG